MPRVTGSGIYGGYLTKPSPKPPAPSRVTGSGIYGGYPLRYTGAPAAAITPTPIASAVAGGDYATDGGYTAGYEQAERPPFDFSTDPGYLAALAAEQAGSAQLDASLRAAREQALVRFGDPSLAGAFGIGDLSPLTAAMTQQATTSGVSTLAGLERTRDLAQQNIQNQLAAQGIIRSGDLGWRTGQNVQNYAADLYNVQQGVLDTLAERARQTALQKQQLHTNTVGALTSAYQSYVNDPRYWGMAGASPPPAETTTPAPVTPATPSARRTTTATPFATAVTQPQMPGFTAP